MTTPRMSGACYRCIHRRDIAGDAHSQCAHPKRNVEWLITRQSRLNIRGTEVGIRNGWFAWPLNYDPTWLENCDGFTAFDAPTSRNEGD